MYCFDYTMLRMQTGERAGMNRNTVADEGRVVSRSVPSPSPSALATLERFSWLHGFHGKSHALSVSDRATVLLSFRSRLFSAKKYFVP